MSLRLPSVAQARPVRVVSLFLLIVVFGKSLDAQTNEDKGTFAIRELSLSTGYAFVQLPPITLNGKLPDGVLSEDLITIGTATADWRRVTARTRYRLDGFGMYTLTT